MREYSRQLMLFTEDFPAEVNPSAWQVSKKGRKTADICGRSFCGWSESLDRVGLLVKTYLEYSSSRQTQFVPTWSVKATASGYGILKLRLSAHRTEGNGCFLWRTPDAHCDRGASSKERWQKKQREGLPISLNDQVAHLWQGSNSGDGLATAVKKQLSAPVGSLSPEWCEWLMGFPAGWTEV